MTISLCDWRQEPNPLYTKLKIACVAYPHAEAFIYKKIIFGNDSIVMKKISNQNGKRMAGVGHAGFTMIEVVAVLMVIGIMTAVVVSRYSNDNHVIPTVESVKSYIRYAQSQAMNSGTVFGIQCSGRQLSMFRGSTVSLVRLPDADADTIDLSQRDVDTMTDFLVYFDNWGVPYTGAPAVLIADNELTTDMVITINGSYKITIVDGTGYIR
jgi:MSHA pilin protein MshC